MTGTVYIMEQTWMRIAPGRLEEIPTKNFWNYFSLILTSVDNHRKAQAVIFSTWLGYRLCCCDGVNIYSPPISWLHCSGLRLAILLRQSGVLPRKQWKSFYVGVVPETGLY